MLALVTARLRSSELGCAVDDTLNDMGTHGALYYGDMAPAAPIWLLWLPWLCFGAEVTRLSASRSRSRPCR
jgi:hypothetical protein